MNKVKFNRALNKFVVSLKRSTPMILSVVAVIGVAATAVTTANATVKATKIISSKREVMTKKDVVKATWHCYIPPAVAFLTTSVCILGAAALNHRQQVSLTSAYALIDSQFKEYKNKVKEIYGEEAHRKILMSLNPERAKNPELYVPSIWGEPCSSLDFGSPNEVEHLFYEEFTGRYFTSTLDKVIEAEYHLNRNMTKGRDMTLNDWLTYLGIEKEEGGDNIGWSVNDFYTWVDFDHSITQMEDGLECYIISVVYDPDPDFGCG